MRAQWRSKGSKLALAGFILVVLLIRLPLIVRWQAELDFDQANAGIAAYHILQGIDFPLFSYGVVYQSSIEGYVAAVLMWGIGTDPWVVRLAPTLFSLGTLAVLWLLLETAGFGSALKWFVCLSAVAPPFFVRWSTLAEAGYPESLFFGSCLFLIYFKARTSGWHRPETCWLLAGFVTGLGLWTFNLFVLFPAALALGAIPSVIRDVKTNLLKLTRGTPLAFAGLVVGGLPMWLQKLGLISVTLDNWEFKPGLTSLETMLEQLRLLVLHGIPMLFGISWPATTLPAQTRDSMDIFLGRNPSALEAALTAAPGILTLALFGGSVVFVTVMVWPNRRKLGTDAKSDLQLVLLALIVINSAAFVFYQNSNHPVHLLRHVRYLYPSYVAFFPLAALALAEIRRRAPNMARAAASITLVFFMWTYSGYLWRAYHIDRSHLELIQALATDGVRAGYATSTWEAFEVAYATSDRIILTPFTGPDDHAGHREFVAGQELVAYVFHEGDALLRTYEQRAREQNWKRIEDGGHHRIYLAYQVPVIQSAAAAGHRRHP